MTGQELALQAALSGQRPLTADELEADAAHREKAMAIIRRVWIDGGKLTDEERARLVRPSQTALATLCGMSWISMAADAEGLAREIEAGRKRVVEIRTEAARVRLSDEERKRRIAWENNE